MIPLLGISLRQQGTGSRKQAKGENIISVRHEFSSGAIAGLATGAVIKGLWDEGFHINELYFDNRLFHVYRDNVSLSVMRKGKNVFVETDIADMVSVRDMFNNAVGSLAESISNYKTDGDFGFQNSVSRGTGFLDSTEALFSLIRPELVITGLRGNTKNEIITELIDRLADRGILTDRDLALNDVLEREKKMSTGMQRGIALPHAKTGGINSLAIVMGTRKEGIDFESSDGEKSRLFVLVVSPLSTSGPHVKFLAAIGTLLRNDLLKEKIINAETPEELIWFLHNPV